MIDSFLVLESPPLQQKQLRGSTFRALWTAFDRLSLDSTWQSGGNQGTPHSAPGLETAGEVTQTQREPLETSWNQTSGMREGRKMKKMCKKCVMLEGTSSSFKCEMRRSTNLLRTMPKRLEPQTTRYGRCWNKTTSSSLLEAESL